MNPTYGSPANEFYITIFSSLLTMTCHCVTVAHSTSLSADIDVKDTGKNVTSSSSSFTCTTAGNVPSTTVSLDVGAILATGGVTNKDCTGDPVDSTALENDLKLAKRRNQTGRKTLLKQERARLAAIAAEAVKLELDGLGSAVGTVDASKEIPTVVSVTSAVEIDPKEVTTVPTVTDTVNTVNTVKSTVPEVEVTDTVISTPPDQKIFTPSLSKTMRRKMKIAKKRSGELANLEEISDANPKKMKIDGNEMIKVGDILIPTSIARSVNTGTVKDIDTAAKSMEVASNQSVIASTSNNDKNHISTEISIPIITLTPAAVPIPIVKPLGVSKGVRKRLKARMKAEEVLAQNPESAEQTNLLKADLLKKAVQANQVKQKLETLTSKVSKVTKYLPPNLRAATTATIATKESIRTEPSATTSNHDTMGKYGPKVTGTNQFNYSNSKYSHMTPTATTHVTSNFNRQNAMTTATSAVGHNSTIGYQQPTSATSWGTQRNLQQTLTQQQQSHQGLSQYSQGAQYSQHTNPTTALTAAYQYEYPAAQSSHAYMDPQSSRQSQYTSNPTIASHYTPSMSSSADLYQQQQQQYSQLALSAATSVAAQQYALGNSSSALATQHYTPSVSLQQQQYGVQYAAPAQQAYHQLQLQNTNTTTPGTHTQNSLHLNAASYGLGTAYTYNTSSFPVNTSQSNSLNSSHYVDATSRQS